MPYDVAGDEHSAASDVSASLAGTAGKRTNTQALPGNAQVGAAGAAAVLDPVERLALHVDLLTVLSSSMDSFHAAIQDARIELLTKSESGWGFLAETLFFAGTGPLIGVATKSIIKALGRTATKAVKHGQLGAASRLSRIKKENIKDVLTNASRGVRTVLVSLAEKSGDRGKAEFLKIVREQIKPLSDGIMMSAKQLTDEELQVLVDAYSDTEAHSVAAYAAAIQDILNRYDANNIDDVGRKRQWEPMMGGDMDGAPKKQNNPIGSYRVGGPAETEVGRLAYVTVHGRRRLALLKRRNDERAFRHWIDRDFEHLAVNLYLERAGAQPDEINLDNGREAAGCPWAPSAHASSVIGPFCADQGSP